VTNRPASRHLALWPVERIVFDLPTHSKQEVLEALLGLAVAGLELAPPARRGLLDLLLAREATGSTAAAQLAIPHAKSPDLHAPVGALGVFPRGIEFHAIDGAPVHAVFLLASPADRAAEHVEILRFIAALARGRDFMRFLRRTASPAEARTLLEVMAGR
jgi:mannitol/fructose-specific phosphotransferase system IIA component (Ntr-type)